MKHRYFFSGNIRPQRIFDRFSNPEEERTNKVMKIILCAFVQSREVKKERWGRQDRRRKYEEKKSLYTEAMCRKKENDVHIKDKIGIELETGSKRASEAVDKGPLINSMLRGKNNRKRKIFPVLKSYVFDMHT